MLVWLRNVKHDYDESADETASKLSEITKQWARVVPRKLLRGNN